MILIPVVILSLESDSDREFMSELFIKNSGLMYKVAWNSTNVPSDVDDIVSGSCVALIRNISTLKKLNDNELRSYIVHTVRGTAINTWKKSRGYRQLFQSVDEDKLENISDQNKGMGTISFFEELDAVKRAIEALPENEKSVIRMKYLDGESDKEIAEQIGIAEGSVRKYIQRARKRIRDTVYRNEA